jgi:predicted nucleic acid-binding protein
MTQPGPPRAFPGTPPPPPGTHDLRLLASSSLRVFIDTNVYFHWSYRAPLAAGAREGDLAVFWSAEIQAEITRVSEREMMAAATRRAQSLPSAERQRAIDATLACVTAERSAQFAALEPFFRVVAGSAMDDAIELNGLSDPDDRPHILAARTAGAPFLLTLDHLHLPHGAIFAGVQCWHPDTFLTLFYQQNPHAYARARRAIKKLPALLGRRILP